LCWHSDVLINLPRGGHASHQLHGLEHVAGDFEAFGHPLNLSAHAYTPRRGFFFGLRFWHAATSLIIGLSQLAIRIQVMNTATSKSSCTIPPKLDERETEMLATRVRAACFESLGCADMSYARAGVSFEQDGRFTKAKHSGFTVASMMGRFSKEVLLNTIRSNIADSTRQVANEVFPRLKNSLLLPRGHVIGYGRRRKRASSSTTR
jgi:hypothetical protein